MGDEGGRKKCGKRGRKREREKDGRGWATAIYRDARNFLVNAHVNRHVAYALCTVYSASCTTERGAARGTRDNEKCTRHDILLARPSYNCRAGSISLSLFSLFLSSRLYLSFSSSPSFSFSCHPLVSHLCVLLQLERGSSETVSGLLNNSLCGLAERCVCTCIDAGLFREIASARYHPPRVTMVETLFRCTAAAVAVAFRFLLVESPFLPF